MSIGKIFNSSVNLSFKGYDKKLDNKGNDIYSFYYPHSDDYKLELELCIKDKKNDKKGILNTIPIEKNVQLLFPKDVTDKSDLYYRFKLTNKNDEKDVKYALDNGIIKDMGLIANSKKPFNKIFTERKIISKTGPMQLQMPDMYYPGLEYNRGEYSINKDVRKNVLNIAKNHVNVLGGTINGMTYKLPEKAKEGYTRIVGTPFTKDEMTSHKYWTQNAYQISSSLGNMTDMKRFQKALFKNGLNFVSDAALVNEGLTGIHFSNVLKWGKNSPFYNWFKTYNLDTNKINLGVIPENSKNLKMRIVNSPVKIQGNPVREDNYNPYEPTYVQLYDSRLASEEQVKANKVFNNYDNNLDNNYEISRYEDVIIPYYVEVNPDELKINLKNNKMQTAEDFSNVEKILKTLNFKNFTIGEKIDSGVELWDGNVDITKLNFVFSNNDADLISKNDVKKYEQGIREVKDYAILSGKYWTKLAADTQLEYAASLFKNVNTEEDIINVINKEIQNKNLPAIIQKNVNKENISYVLKNEYNLFKLNSISKYNKIDSKGKISEKNTDKYKDILTKSIMNVPFESLEVDNDIISLLSSGYFSKRANTDEQLGLTRFDMYMSNYPNFNSEYKDIYKRVDNVLTNGVFGILNDVITNYDNLSNTVKIKNNDNATDFGKYAINAIGQDFTKYILIKALDKDANIKLENDGSFNFDNIDKSKISLKNLGLNSSTVNKEIENLSDKIEEGVRNLSSNQAELNKLTTALSRRLNGLNENSFKIADMLIDRTESGFGLRIDASKDIASFEAIGESRDDLSKAWNEVVDFWGKYIKYGVHSENPHGYTTAEVTDIAKYINKTKIGDINSSPETDRIMLEKTGVTSIANYAYLFSMPTGIYSMNPETGTWNGFEIISNIKSKLDCLDDTGWYDTKGMLFEAAPDSSINSYTFVGNHDKPRMLHVLGLDMNLYNSNFEDDRSKEAANYVLNTNFDDEDFELNDISAPAIAMGKRIKDIFNDMTKTNNDDKINTSIEKLLTEADFEKLSNVIADMANGIYTDKKGNKVQFNADAFGERPFNFVINDIIDQANLEMEDSDIKYLKDKTLEYMLNPAMEKFKSIYKMLILLPGAPTDFAGDKEASTGFESISKNITQQNRNAINWEWIDENSSDYKGFIAKYKNDLNEIMNLRNDPRLSALNNGHTISLKNYKNDDELNHSELREYAANLRYDEKSMVMTIFGRPDLGSYPDPAKNIGDKKVLISSIDLSNPRQREGLAAGLTEGTIFKNINNSDNSIYKVDKINGAYVLNRYLDNEIKNIEISKDDDNALVLYRI